MEILRSLFIKNVKSHTIFIFLLKFLSLYSDLNISVPSFTFFSNPPSLPYFMPFRIISCCNFKDWCNKHTQNIIVTHNTQPFCCSTNSYLATLLAAGLCTCIISLQIQFVDSLVFLPIPF